MKANLKFPVLGYIEIRLIEKHDFKWLAEIIETGMHIEIFEDQFELDRPKLDTPVMTFSDVRINHST